MFTQTYRPSTFETMAGQDLNKRILKSIIANPERSPRSLIFYGAYGSGKTSSARLLARALNCSASHKPCGKCEACTCDLDSSSFYSEFDSSVIGNVDKIRELRDTFYYTSPNSWSVKVFDESHLVSAQAMSALLKVIEEAPSRVIFVFCTTEVQKMLRTIRSRSLELRFDPVPHDAIVSNLSYICNQENIKASPDILDIIAKKSRGHMRNAHMLLDKYFMVGEYNFLQSVATSHKFIVSYFESIAKKDKNLCFQSIDSILTFPLADVRQDFQEVVGDIARVMVGNVEGRESYVPLVRLFGPDILKIVRAAIAEWFVTSFSSDMILRTALLAFYQMFAQQNKQAVQSSISRATARR